MDSRHFIAKNVAAMFRDGDVVNLGIGIPTLASLYIPPEITVFFHAENGCVGADKTFTKPWNPESTRESVIRWLSEHRQYSGTGAEQHKDLCNAGNESITLLPGASCFDSCLSFAIAKGGRLSATVLGALQVDRNCDLANWKIPGKKLNGMGGAMDIVSGARRVIVAMEHCTKKGEPKIVETCSFPLTALACVDTIVTELCIIDCVPGRLTVTALAPGVERQDVLNRTEAELCFADDPGTMLV